MATGVDARLLKTTKFPPEFNQKVDMTKVNLQVMKKWIAGKVTEILGTEDDVVIELIFNLIETTRNPDIKGLQIQLTGFLDKDTAPFCKELWTLLLSAQTSPQGVPKELLEAKKLELIQEKPKKRQKKPASDAKKWNAATEGDEDGVAEGATPGGEGGEMIAISVEGGAGLGEAVVEVGGHLLPGATEARHRSVATWWAGGRSEEEEDEVGYTVEVEVTICRLGLVTIEVEECERRQPQVGFQVEESATTEERSITCARWAQTIEKPAAARRSQPVRVIRPSLSRPEAQALLLLPQSIVILLPLTVPIIQPLAITIPFSHTAPRSQGPSIEQEP
ncbi:PWI domain-containing protein [Coniochaeta sp. 2T2.1]|nr:PWI domain-containing protein [Coniochaeta sp. 2T2.1]